MSDLVWFALLLPFLVAAGVFMWWDLDVTRRKAERWIVVERLRQERRGEEMAWDLFWTAAEERRQEIEESFLAADAVDRLIELIQKPARLELVK